jgi:peptidoglycan/LPS O-acetylase OafA/YrhL
MFERMTGRVLTTTDGASSALGNEAGKLIVLGGHFAPILVTMLYVVLVIAVASLSYYLIEMSGQELFARLARWPWRRPGSLALDGDRQPAQSAGAAH